MSDVQDPRGRQLERNLGELLQEIRVAQAGVQILFGFLLSIAFTDRYASAGAYLRITHLITVLFATAAVALLTAPAAWHRILFRFGRREQIVRVADRCAVAGLVSLALAITGTVLVLTELVLGGWPAVVCSSVVAAALGVLWFALPARLRLRGPAHER